MPDSEEGDSLSEHCVEGEDDDEINVEGLTSDLAQLVKAGELTLDQARALQPCIAPANQIGVAAESEVEVTAVAENEFDVAAESEIEVTAVAESVKEPAITAPTSSEPKAQLHALAGESARNGDDVEMKKVGVVKERDVVNRWGWSSN